MSVSNFIPVVWSSRILAHLQKTLVYAQNGVVNRDWEGEIKNHGDSVKITAIGKVSTKDYTRNVEIADPEQLTTAASSLIIDQAKYFNFSVDDLDAAQTKKDGNLVDQGSAEAAYSLADGIDQFIAGLMKIDAPTASATGTTSSAYDIAMDDTHVDLSNAYDLLVDIGVLLRKRNLPQSTPKFVVVPPDFIKYVAKDKRFIDASASGTTDLLLNGVIKRAAGFNIVESNNVPVTSSTKYHIIAGTAAATTYADNIVQMEAYRPEKMFADAVKGVHVYGAKVIRPEQLHQAVVTFS